MSPSTRNTKETAKGGTPVQKSSANSKGKKGKLLVVPSPSKKDKRNQWVYEMLKGDFDAHFLKKPGKDAESFAFKFFQDLEDEDVLASLGCSVVLSRRGADDDFLPQDANSTWPWRALVFYNEGEQSEERCITQATEGINLFNESCTQEFYKFPCKMRLGANNTEDPKRAVDAMFMDSDVIRLMEAAHGDHMSLEEMKTDDKIMADFWTDPVEGAQIMDRHVFDVDATHNENE